MTAGLGSVLVSGAVAAGLAIATAVVLMTGRPAAPPAPAAVAGAGAPTAPLYEQGRTTFQAKGCIGCHNVTDKGLVSRTGIAPDLSALGQRAAARRPGLAAEDYVKESVRQPQAYIVPGFSEVQMPILPVSDVDLEAIVAFLLAPPPRP